MKRILWLIEVLCLAVAVCVMGSMAGASEPTLCDYRAYGIDAGKFFVYLTRDTPYTLWNRWPETGPSRTAVSPHGPLQAIYVNAAAYAALSKKEKMAFGSLIVMENRGRDGKVDNLAVRIKLKGYYPEEGDWYWFSFRSDGTAAEEGRVASCIGCHGKMRDNDHLLSLTAGEK